jgi:1,4-alpha-glucan branching enzyme
MAQEREGVGTYREFADVVLPRVKALGYNTIQMMAVQEHPYYGSFGYHVSNFFAPSSRFGTPDDLRYLIDTAHGMGIAVIMDIVHSHAVKNMAEGLNDFDGSGGQYFHTGGRGYHEGWDSKCFDYGKWEVQQFLLSNCSYWLEEFNFDGYRFDGVTSLLYLHHGNISFGNYDSYFRNGVDWDAETYLTLANLLIHEVKSNALSIAEDMSGMPGLCRKPEDGGIGFDFRLAMGLPDYWIKLLKHSSDDHWDMFGLWYELTNRRQREKTIAYAESHDQALVGDKTIAFWLMDAAMYTDMSVFTESLIVDRGIALHKLIRLVTLALGGEAYLNFMGNEFGHPEWIDFPREGNGWSHRYARRQWSLPDTEHLKYKYLEAFDKGMLPLITEKHVLTSGFAKQRYLQNDQKLLVFERGDVIFAFNFHPSQPTEDLRFMVEKEGNYRIVLNSDLPEYGGFDRIDNTYLYETEADDKGDIWLQVYLPNRMALVLELVAGE